MGMICCELRPCLQAQESEGEVRPEAERGRAVKTIIDNSLRFTQEHGFWFSNSLQLTLHMLASSLEMPSV